MEIRIILRTERGSEIKLYLGLSAQNFNVKAKIFIQKAQSNSYTGFKSNIGYTSKKKEKEYVRYFNDNRKGTCVKV